MCVFALTTHPCKFKHTINPLIDFSAIFQDFSSGASDFEENSDSDSSFTEKRRKRKKAKKAKMAPIFRRCANGADASESEEEVVELTEEQRELLRRKQEFLRSGIPEELRRKETQGVVLTSLPEHAPWPDASNVHVLQQVDDLLTY